MKKCASTGTLFLQSTSMATFPIFLRWAGTLRCSGLHYHVTDKEFGCDRRFSLESKVRHGARKNYRKLKVSERRKKTARSDAVWCTHSLTHADTRWRTREASLTMRCVRALLRSVPARLDSSRLGSVLLGSARPFRRARSVWLAKRGTKSSPTTATGLLRGRPARKRVATGIRDSWTNQPVCIRPFGPSTIVGRTRGPRCADNSAVRSIDDAQQFVRFFKR